MRPLFVFKFPLADTKSNESTLNLCVTTRVTFIFQVLDQVNYPTNTTTMMVPFAATAAWLWRISVLSR